MKELLPCDLEPEDVEIIYKRCIPRKHSTEIIRTVLFQKEHGFKEDSRAVYFDKGMIELSRPQLEYSLGQLQDVHENYTSVTTESVKDRYDGVQWTDNTATVMAYLHLLLAAGLVKPIEFSTGELKFYDVIIPTLSSRDSNLKNWYLQNKDRICIEFFDRLLGLEPTNK